MAEIEAKGGEFAGPPVEQPWGLTVNVIVPGAGELTIYEPKYDPPALH